MIRAATPADAPAIMAIWNAAIRDTTVTFSPLEKTADEVIALTATACLVAEEGGQAIAFARYFQFRSGPGYAHTAEHTILVQPSATGRGIGRSLMDVLCDHARDAGFHSTVAAVSAENAAGIAFHAACGFRKVACLPEVGFKFGRWIDLVLMQKRL